MVSAGTRLGPYEILAPLGSGGMGEVFTARDTRLDRTVAIKVLTRSTLDALSPSRIERFRHEARTIGRLSHPNICALYDIGEEGPLVFLVMEHVAGQTLAQRLESGPLPLKTASSIAIQMADALDYAHRHGVVHRDLKPSNVMITRDATKLLDFGLAKLAASDERARSMAETVSTPLTAEGLVVGTVPYMSPEQIEGREVDARTDLFSFGIVLYELVAGRRPFEGGSSARVMASILAEDPIPLALRQPLTPPALERVVHRCLAKDPEDRWQTARDLAAELRWIAAAVDSQSGAASSVAAVNRSRRRLWGGVAAAALIVGVGGVAAWTWPRGSEPRAAAFRQVTFRRGAVSSARFAPDGQSVIYSASWEGQPYGVHLARPGTGDARALGLEAARMLSVSRAGDLALLFGRQEINRGFGVLATVPLAGGARRDRLQGVVDADWIPGTDTLAVIREGAAGQPWSIEFPLGKTVHQARAAWSLRVSPDGQRIAFFEGPVVFDSVPDDAITVIDATGERSVIAQGWAGLGLAWRPDGREVWFAATKGDRPPSLQGATLNGTHREVYTAPDWLVLHDIAADGRVLLTRNTIRIAIACQRAGESYERDLTWLGGGQVRDVSDDGQMVLFTEALSGSSAGQPTFFRRALDGSAAIRLGEGVPQSFSPDGQSVLVRADEQWVIVPTGAGAPKTLPRGSVRRAGNAAWLPDGRRIAFTGFETDDTNRSRIFVQDVGGGEPIAVSPEGWTVVRHAAATTDGRSVLAYANGPIQLYPIDGGSPTPVAGVPPTDRVLGWTHDGRSLYVTTEPRPGRNLSGDIFVVDIASGRRSRWRTVAPADAVGVDRISFPVIARRNDTYCYSYQRRLGDLFVADGLR